MTDHIYEAKILTLVRKVRFAEKVAADIGSCLDELVDHNARHDPQPASEVRRALDFYRGTINSVHLLLESMFWRLENPDESKPVDELCRTVRVP